jgi:hypothetical protein
MAYTTIDDPSAYFQTTLYTGNDTDGTQITNSGNSDLKPDWLWIKNRTDGGNPPATGGIWDSSRGFAENKVITSFTNNAEGANSNGFAVATTDGFTVEDGTSGSNPRTATNKNGKNYVAWQWKANGGTTTSNSSGSNGAEADSVYQVNNTAGFSIGTYTGGGGGTFNIAIYTGLSAACEAVIVKNRDASKDWAVGFGEKVSTSAARYLSFNNNDAAKSVGSNSSERQQGAINVNNFGAGLFDVTSGGAGDDDVYASGEKYVFYAFRSIKGYSKIGKYTGNGNAAGPYIHLGFKPRFIIIKGLERTSSWFLIDSARDINSLGAANTDGSADSQHQQLFGEANDAEGTYNSTAGDFLANGYKLRATSASTNTNGEDYAYIAFAEHPFVSSTGTPVTAR